MLGTIMLIVEICTGTLPLKGNNHFIYKLSHAVQHHRAWIDFYSRPDGLALNSRRLTVPC